MTGQWNKRKGLGKGKEREDRRKIEKDEGCMRGQEGRKAGRKKKQDVDLIGCQKEGEKEGNEGKRVGSKDGGRKEGKEGINNERMMGGRKEGKKGKV